jgi:hypothetical protein
MRARREAARLVGMVLSLHQALEERALDRVSVRNSV